MHSSHVCVVMHVLVDCTSLAWNGVVRVNLHLHDTPLYSRAAAEWSDMHNSVDPQSFVDAGCIIAT